MPAEKRFSNTDPRDVFIRLNPLGLGEAELRKESTGFEDPRTHSDYLLFLAGYRKTHPEPQPHPEPIAWMVGTAIWWTKEEAERDAAATGLPMIPFGPLTGEVEQHPGEPVVLPVCKAKLSMGHDWDQGYADGWRTCLDEIGKLGPLYTRADHGEVERARESHRLHAARLIDERGRFRAQLAEQTALLREIADHCNGCVMPTEQLLREWGSSIDAALSASAELSAPTWSCQPCKIEHPTDRPCDACGGATELKI
ncbi:hypothetical protein AB7M33_005242 [Pseudomonas sp. Y3 TE3536]